MADNENGSLFTPLGLEPIELPTAQPAGGYTPLFGQVERKAFDLDRAVTRKQRNLDNSAISKLGLGAEDPLGQVANLYARAASGASRFIGNVATAPIDTVTDMAQASVPNTHIDAYSRVKSGRPLPGDEALLAQTAPGDDGVPQTYAERMQGIDGLRQVSKSIAETMDISSIVDTTRADRLSDELEYETAGGVSQLRQAGDDFDKGNYLDAAGNALGGGFRTLGSALSAGIQDPGAVSEYVVENVPQLAAMAINPLLGTVGNAGYGLNEYRDGITDYQENNLGEMPDAEDRLRMGLFAASAALAEQVGDVSLLKGMGGWKGVPKPVTAVPGAMAREGVTEGYQTFAENEAHLQDTSIEQVVEGATIGALVGGNFQGIASVAGSGKEAAAKIDRNTTVEKEFNTAAETGDVSALSDVKSPVYDPVRAVNALHQFAMKGDEAAVAQSLAQADQIQQDLTQQVSEAQARIELASPEAIADSRDLLARMTAAGASQAEIAMVEEEIAAAEAYTPAQRKADTAEMQRLENQLGEVRNAAERMQVDTSPEQADVTAIAQQAEAGDTQAFDRLLTLTMINPESVDTQVADSLAASPNLSVGQRTAMRAFSEAQVAANALKGAAGVRSDIATGGDGFKGIPQYRSAIRMALANGNVEAARSQVDGIASFAASRVSKLEAITAAYEQVKGTDNSINIVRDEQGVWGPTDLKGKALKEAGGLVIDRKSFKLRDDVSLEAEVLTKTTNAYEALLQAVPSPVVAAPLQAQPIAPETPAPVTEEAQTTEETQSAPESTVAEQVVDTPVAEASQETGKLTALRNRPSEPVTAENYTSQNLVGALFDQQAGNETDATVRPLVSVENFASKVGTGEVNVAEYLDQEGPLTGPQTAAVNGFFKFARDTAQAVRDQFKLKDNRAKYPEFFYRDMAQFLVNEDGQIDENLATAVSYGMYSWTNENATQLRNSDESINAILLRDSDTAIESPAYELLSTVGTREAVVAAQLGARIIQALGLRVNAQGTQAEQSKLEATVGARAIAAMVSAGIAERVQVSGPVLQALIDPSKESDVPFHNFVRIKAAEVNGRMEAAQAVADVRAANVGSQSVLSKLFSVEAAGIEPSYTPVKFDQLYAKRTQQDVPKVLAETLEKEGAKAHTVRANMYHLWSNFSSNLLYGIAGVIDTTDVPTHVENLASRNAKNDGLRQQVDNFSSFVKTMIEDPSTNALEQKLYFGRSVWKPQRVGISANVINPQTSKVHRHMLAMESWKAKVDPANPQSMNNFKLRVLEAFGVKTEATNTDVVLKKYDDKVNGPAIQAAISALATILRDEHTSVDEAVILAGVKAGGENFHSFDALVALAELQNAAGQPFETSMMGEVDGVTNGPMLSLVMLGAKGFDTLNQGGFFEQGSEFSQFNDFHAKDGNLDLYESNISATLSRMQGRNTTALAAMQVITGKLQTPEGDVTSKGRKIIKQPLTALMFGSNPKTAVDGMADGFIESIYSKMEDAAQARSEADTQAVLASVNTLMGNKRLALDDRMGIERAMTTRLTVQQKAALKNSFYELIGKPTEDALADNYSLFIERRNVINQTAQLSFDLYKAAYDAVVESVTESTAMPMSKGKKPEAIRILTKAQLAEVNKRLDGMSPVLQTAMSLASNQPSAGMHMAKSETTLDRSTPFTSEVAFGQPVETIDPTGKPQMMGSTLVSGSRTESIDPGVMPFITSIHSTDSAIASSVYGSMDALNVHDALGVDLANVQKVGQELNKATFNQMLNYSSPSEMSNLLDRTLNKMSELLQDEDLAVRIQPKLLSLVQAENARKPKKKRGTFAQQLESIRHVATQADTAKLGMLATMQAVGQYATDGGSYLVTEADRTAALEKLAAVGSSFNEGAVAAANQLVELAVSEPLVRKPSNKAELSNDSVTSLAPATSLNTLDRVARTAEDQLAQDIAAVTDSMVSGNRTLSDAVEILPNERAAEVVDAVSSATQGKTSVWGQLGTPLVHSDANLVQLLETTEMTAHNLADALIAYTADPFTQKLLQMVKRAVSPSVSVNYITSNTGPEGAIGEGVDKSRGWYAQRNNTAGVYIKSTEFVESGITTELLTHELVHAALASLVDRNTSKSNDVGQAIADLETLCTKAAEMISNNGEMSAKYRNATSNVHELLAWGLTNQDFQKEVLAKISMPTRRNGILDGLKSFIDSLVKMLFPGQAVRYNTGMAMLVANSAGLFREATKLRQSRDTQTHKYEDAMDHVNAMTAGQVFDGLATLPGAKTDAAHAIYLRNLLESATDPLYGPYGAFKEEAKANMALTPMDVFLKAVDTGKMPFSSAAVNNAFIINQQEAFVLESVEVVVQEAMNNPRTLFVREALENLFKEARATLKPFNFHAGDWTKASDNEKKIAQAKYDFLFRPAQNIGGKQSHLSRFAALGMASREVKNLLTFATADHTKPLKSLPWAAKLIELFHRLVTKLASLHTKVKPGDRADAALSTLVGDLVDIEAKHKKKMADRRVSGLDQLEASLGNVADNVRERAEAFGKLPFFRESSSPLVKLAGVGLSTLAGERVEGVLNHITKLRDKAQKSQHGLIMGIVGEMRGSHNGIALATELFKQAKRDEKARKDHIEYTIAQVNAAFADGGANLTDETRAALTKVFLRTNASAIADVIGTNGLKDLMEDPQAMAKFRSDLEQQVIAATPYANYMISQTKDLAHHKVVGSSTSANLMLNTGNITAMYGTNKATNPDAKLAGLLDQLVAVYALEYSDDVAKGQAMEVLRSESARADNQNGVDLVLKMHSGLQKKSTEMLFKGTEALQTTGYTPEIHDNKIEVVLVEQGRAIDAHLRAGYAIGTNLQEDPHVGFQSNRVLMTRRGAGQTGLLTGAMSYTGMSSKGSSPVAEAKNMMQGTQTTSAQVRRQIAAAKAQPINDLFNRGLSYDPRKAKSGHMAPTLAPDGRIADYRHLMTEHNRDVLLDRDNSMDQILGTLSGQIVDKVNTAAQNTDVVRSLYDQYQDDYTNRPSSYLMVGADSQDGQLAELYRLLPEATKREIRKVWKGDNMFIPADQINLIMGYRKYSLTEPFAALPTERNIFEKTLVTVMEHVFGAKAALRVGIAEDVMQAVVKEIKDILVVKNIFTLVGNIMSNMTVLAWEGVPIAKAAASHAIAIKGALDYRADNKRLLQLTQALEIGYVPQGTAVVENEIVELRDRLARNPLKPLIDAGLMPTIVEDIEANDSQYSYQSRLQQKTEKYTSKAPAWLRSVGKQVYLTHDTSIYKFLSQSTQLSDLVARYSMYEHVTTRKKDPLSQTDALKLAEESFVNYDLPSHRSMQFMNDMGVVFFTKYYLRIQKVISRLVRERPARGLALAAANHYWEGLQSIMDSSWLNKLGNNPFSSGAFGYIGALDELPAIKLL